LSGLILADLETYRPSPHAWLPASTRPWTCARRSGSLRPRRRRCG